MPGMISRWISHGGPFVLRATAAFLLFMACSAAGQVELLAAAEIDDLVELVHADAGLCATATDLGQELPRVWMSPLAERLRQLPVVRHWRNSADYQNLLNAAAAIEKLTGRPLPEVAFALFGRAVVFSVYRDQEPRPYGVLLTRAINPEALQTALSLWTSSQHIETMRKEHAGQVYFAGRAAAGGDSATIFYLIHDDIAAVSDHEAGVQRVAALVAQRRRATEKGAPAVARDDLLKTLAVDAGYRESRASISPQCRVSVFINPHFWDGDLHVDQAADPVSRMLASAWRSCRSLIIGLRFQNGVAVEATAACDPDKTSPEWRAFEETTKGPAEFVARTPVDALFVLGLYGDLKKLAAALPRPQDDAAIRSLRGFRQVARGLCLGLDPFVDVLPQFGPNWGCYLVPGRDARPEGSPLDGVLACELVSEANTSPRGRASVHAALENALQSGFNFWAAIHNSSAPESAAVVRSAEREGTMYHWIEGMGACQPTFAITSTHVALATSPDALSEFLHPAPGRPVLETPEFQQATRAGIAQHSQFWFVNLAQSRHMLETRRELLVQQVAHNHALPPAEIARRLARLDGVLNLFNGAFAGLQIAPNRIHLVIGGVPAE